MNCRSCISRQFVATTVAVLCLLVIPHCTAQETGEHHIDACVAVNNGGQVTIVAEHNDGAVAATVFVYFTNCAIPDDTNITIAVPPQPQSNIDTTRTAVQIVIINTTLQGGSMQIIPHTTTQPPSPSAVNQAHHLSLQNVHITVDNAVLAGVGDILVIKTTPPAPPTSTSTPMVFVVEDVKIVLQNVVLSSSTGSVASIVTTPTSNSSAHADTAARCHIQIGGNSSIEAMYLVGSVQTSKIINSTLSVDNNFVVATQEDASSCMVGPIRLVGGGPTVNGQVGVLSVLPSSGDDDDGAVLHVDNIQISVRRNPIHLKASTNCVPSANTQLLFSLVAKANVGTAAIASIAILHRDNAHLTMTGVVSIKVLASHHTSTASHSNTGMTGGLTPPSSMILNASVMSTFSVAAVGGIALLAYWRDTSSNAGILLLRCALRLLFVSSHQEHDVFLQAFTATDFTALTVLGVVMNAQSNQRGVFSHNHLVIIDSSSLTIQCIKSEDGNVTMMSRSNGGNLASAVLGVALAASTKVPVNNVTIDGSSSLIIGCTTGGTGTVLITSDVDAYVGFLASAVLGIAMQTYSSQKSTNILNIDDHSTMTLGYTTAESCNVVMTSRSRGHLVASSILGVGVLTMGSSTTIVTIDRGSSLTIGSRIIGSGTIAMASRTAGNNVVSSVSSVALSSDAGQGARVFFIVNRTSTLNIGCSVDSSGKISKVSEVHSVHGKRYASAVVGVALNCHSVTVISTNVMAIDVNSNVTIGCTKTGDGNMTLTPPSRRNHNFASAILGVAMNTFCSQYSSSNTNLTVGGRSTLAIVVTTASGGTDRMVSPTTGSYAACALLGIAINSLAQNQRRPSSVSINNNSTIHIMGLLASGDATATTEGTTAVSTVGGIIVNGHRDDAAIVVQPPEVVVDDGDSASPSTVAIDVWIGLQRSSKMSIEAPEKSLAGVVVGLVAKNFQGLNNQNTLISLCRDHVTEVPTAIGGGLALATRPNISGMAVKQTSGWEYESTGHVNVHHDLLLCSENATRLQAMLALAIPNITRMLASASWPPLGPTDAKDPTSTNTVSTSTTHIGDVAINTTISLAIPSSTTSRTLSHSSQTAVLSSLPITKPITPTQSLQRENTQYSHTLSVTVVEFHHEPSVTPAPSTVVPTNSPNSSTSRKRTASVTTSVLLPNNEEAATVVLTTAGASGAVASTVGSTGAGVVVTAGASVRMMECGLAEDDPRPARFELPIQFAIGNGVMRFFAGAVLAHTILQCVMLSACVLLHRRQKYKVASSKSMKYFSMMFCGAHPFFTPTILGACSTVLFNDSNTLAVAVAAMCALAIATIHSVVVLAVHHAPSNGLSTRHVRPPIGGGKAKLEFKVNRCVSNESTSSSNDSGDSTSGGNGGQTSTVFFSAQATKNILLTLFDGCRHFEKASHRHYSSIETILYSVIAIISGARPQQNCNTAAFVIGLLAALQLAYTVFVRPFRTKLDMIFSVLNGATLLLLSMAVAILVQERSDDGDGAPPREWALRAVEACLWMISVLGFVQLGVQGYWAYHVEQRRRQSRGKASSSSSNSSADESSSSSSDSSHSNNDDDPKAAPLLVTPEEMEERTEETNRRNTHHNPLLERK